MWTQADAQLAWLWLIVLGWGLIVLMVAVMQWREDRKERKAERKGGKR